MRILHIEKLKKYAKRHIYWVAWGTAIGFFMLAFLYHAWLGRMIWDIGHAPEAALFLDQDAGLALEIGNYYFNTNGDGQYDLKKASYYFMRALAMDPHVPDAWHQLSRIDFLRGHFPDALIKINTQIELHGNSLMASYYIRGLIYGFLGNTSAAEKDFKIFLSWDTKNWAAHNDLAWIYFSKGNYRNAETIARQGLAFNPRNTWLLTSLGVALLNEGKKEEAHTVLADALKESEKLTPSDWHRAYPGNDPLLGDTGLQKMREVIKRNLLLVS